MPHSAWALAAAALAVTARAASPSLDSVCTAAYASAKLPMQELYLEDGTFTSVSVDASSISVLSGYNYSVSDNVMYPDTVIDYCQVTFAYSHTGQDDRVQVLYWMPTPSAFQNRYLTTGGGGLAINSGNTSLPGGVQYGAVSGITDGGFGSFTTQYDAVSLLANGTLNNNALYMFGYKAIHEMTFLGQLFTQNFYNMSTGTKLYSYYQACSEGGREGWSQVQRFTSFDGAVIGAPAFRYGHQQVNHLTSSVIEYTQDYYPPPCELTRILNATLAFCDPLDGYTDGVVSRTDLCILEFDLNSTIGLPYSCAASTGGGMAKRQMGSAATPAQNGTVSAQAVAVARTILGGLHDSQGRRAYLSYQPSATWTDATTAYDSTTDTWGLSIDGLGGEWVARWLQLLNGTLTSYEGITYDTLRNWMYEGMQKYEDVLQTTWPDLTPYHDAGGKVLHYHGESDYSIPTASSVHYWESVRRIMYSNMTYNDSADALNDWYRLYLVPGGSHCSNNANEPNGPWPQTNLAVMIDWVENGVVPTTLNATHLAGDFLGSNAQICAWPLRPLWINNGTTMECVYDQASLDTWMYDFDSFPVPVY